MPVRPWNSRAFDHAALDEGGGHDFLDVLGLDPDIEVAAGIDDNQGAKLAKAVAAGGHHFHAVGQTVGLDGLVEGIAHGLAARGRTARAPADEDLELFVGGLAVIVAQCDFGFGGFPDLPEVGGGSKAGIFGHDILTVLDGDPGERQCDRSSRGMRYARRRGGRSTTGSCRECPEYRRGSAGRGSDR